MLSLIMADSTIFKHTSMNLWSLLPLSNVTVSSSMTPSSPLMSVRMDIARTRSSGSTFGQFSTMWYGVSSLKSVEIAKLNNCNFRSWPLPPYPLNVNYSYFNFATKWRRFLGTPAAFSYILDHILLCALSSNKTNINVLCHTLLLLILLWFVVEGSLFFTPSSEPNDLHFLFLWIWRQMDKYRRRSIGQPWFL